MPELDLRNLKIELKTVTNWYSLGIQLNVPDYELRKIDQDFHGSDHKMSAMLSHWLNNCSEDKLSWQTIADALKHIQHNNLARKLEGNILGAQNMYPAEGNNSGLTHRKQGYGSSGEGSGSTTETTRSTPVNAGTWNRHCLCLVVVGAVTIIGIVAGVLWLLNNRTVIKTERVFDEKPRMDELFLLRLPDGKAVTIVQSIAVSFQEFGCHLLNDVEGTKVDNIYHDNMNKAEETTVSVFKKWLAGSGKRPVTWRTLIGVLEDMKKHELARQIKEALYA